VIQGAEQTMTDIPQTVAEAAALLRSGELTSVELTTAVLARADILDPLIGTYVTRLDTSALASAEQADADFSNGVDRGPFQGIPIGIKDILATAAGPTTANSLVLDREWGAGKDAPVVARLKAAGAVITGKTTTSEFACGSPDPSKPFAVPRNPWNTDHSPAGSSAGTGNGVAAGLFLAGLGTDTGGSIRSPASMNGITGLKPTFGLVPKSGCVPLGYSLDHVGPMARTARDCAALLAIIAGYDPSDECSADRPVADFTGALTGSLEGVRVGVEREHHFPDDADPALAGCFEAAVEALVVLGATPVEVSLPYYQQMRAAMMAIMLSEALAYHRDDLRDRWDDYYAATRLNLAFGALVSSNDYVQAQRARRLTKRKLAELFTTVDVVVTPTSLTAAPRISDLPTSIVPRLLKTSCTSYWNVMGQPALAVPMGFNADGLPLSLQIAGRPFEDALVLQTGDAFQSATTWHRQTPTMLEVAVAAA
jgi:aspartyl-tRNA(Asn)/glutamyl-tRNA(Gln) amidotransferase subunit A